jgi:hypothetical protein
MTASDRRHPQQLTPQQRLALSRRALVRQLNGGVDDESYDRNDARSRLDDPDDLEYAHHEAQAAGRRRAHPQDRGEGNPGEQGEGGGRRRNGNVWLAVGRSVLERWWRRHPAHAVGQLARPMLEHYARKEPAKLMAAAAATGAVLVLVRPWRLLSATAVLAAVLKTSDVADLINTLMSKTPSSPRPPRKDSP